MGIKDRLEGKEFSSLGPFADALAAGVADELAPTLAKIASLEQAIAQLGGQVATAQSTADGAAKAAQDAAKAADDAKKAAQPTPTPTPSKSAGATGGPEATPTTTPGVTPSITPTPSASPRPTLFMLALPNPIFVGDIFNGGFRTTANISLNPLEGAAFVGSGVELTISNIDSTVEFVNWTDKNGQILGTSNPIVVTVSEDTTSINANFRQK